jgi:hypothetical protein
MITGLPTDSNPGPLKHVVVTETQTSWRVMSCNWQICLSGVTGRTEGRRGWRRVESCPSLYRQRALCVLRAQELGTGVHLPHRGSRKDTDSLAAKTKANATETETRHWTRSTTSFVLSTILIICLPKIPSLSHLIFRLPNSRFRSGFSIRNLYAFLVTCILAPRPIHLPHTSLSWHC